MHHPISRRAALAAAAGALTAPAAVSSVSAAESAEPFGYCFNTSTIRGQNLPLTKVVEIVGQAGYRGIEPWIREIDAHVSSSGTLADLRKRITDAGLKVESAIGFAEWIADDDAKRAKGMEEARRTMDLVAQLGGTRIAAPPAGGTKESLDLRKVAERYRALCELGERMGVTPQAEVWGFSQTLSRLSETTYVAIESGHPQACILPDIYHLYKGGSDFNTLKLLSGAGVHVFHVNDYPADPPRAQITDAQRVYPGDGIAPVSQILRDLHMAGFRGMLSLELFNKDYYQQDPLTVAKTGLEKMKAAVARALA
jgi:2-keto-myo-inositol isomerase